MHPSVILSGHYVRTVPFGKRKGPALLVRRPTAVELCARGIGGEVLVRRSKDHKFLRGNVHDIWHDDTLREWLVEVDRADGNLRTYKLKNVRIECQTA